MRDGLNLKPRAVAVLVALRSGPRTRAQLRHAIGDPSATATADLLGDMRSGLLPRARLIEQLAGDDRWYLTHDGVEWLETNGLSVEREAMLHVASGLAEAARR